MAVRQYRPLAQVRAVGGPYVDQVVADFRALPPEVASHPRYAQAQALAASSDSLDWQQLFTLELWVLQLMPLPLLETRAAVLEQLFSHLPTPRPGSDLPDYESRLRGWALALQSERQWAFRKNLLREQEGWMMRRRLNDTMLVISAVAALLGWMAVVGRQAAVGALLGVCWLGAAGAYASIARRIQSAGVTRPGQADGGSALGNLCALDIGQDSVVQGLLLGGLFAAIGYFLLAGNVLQLVFSSSLTGALVPAFSTQINSNDVWLAWLMPANASGCAKLAVWSFLFGFAERLVPDVLDKLSGRLDQKPAKTRAGKGG